MQALLTGFAGAADLNKTDWLMASVLGAYLAQQMDAVSKGTQHLTSLQIDGDRGTVLVEGRKAAFVLGAGPQAPAEWR